MEPNILKPSWMNWAGMIILSVFLILSGIILAAFAGKGIVYLVIGIILLILGIWNIISVVIKRAALTYSYDNEKVKVKWGIISSKTSEIAIKDIKNITFNQGIDDRIFGIGTIGFASAGTGRIEVVFRGIKNAKQIKEELDKLIQTVREGTIGKKKCPQCAEMVQGEAKVCRFCGYKFEEQ